jgi:hypothetical protein
LFSYNSPLTINEVLFTGGGSLEPCGSGTAVQIIE